MALALDETDRKILRMLQTNARTSNSEIARQLGMVPSAILERIRKLEERGIILGYEARVSPAALGLGLVAFISVKTDDRTHEYEAAEKLKKFPEVQEVHNVAGEDCYLVKVRVADVGALRDFLHDKIPTIGSVVSTRSTIVLHVEKESMKLPIEPAATVARPPARFASGRITT
ncbi:MAG TPA: Lrp/AsnC family transcriptional regulator [Candidatus Thermoplasmatota archaeon]|nr:Lrp/AsnC family transcriptional regulator [Candidatus Thermoplasmatota archaeon]